MQVGRVADPGVEWDRFAESRPGACLGHAAAWAHALRVGYGIEPVYLVARNGEGAIRGVLPLARFRSLGGRRALVSLPFVDSAGLLADDAEAEHALLETALAEAAGAPLELRQTRPAPGTPTGETNRVDLYLPLGGGPELRWRALPAKVRNQTRKATQQGLTLAPDLADRTGAFHRLHCAGMRELGSPPHAEAFLRAVVEGFGERARVLVAVDGERPIGGLVAIHYAGAVTVPWASALRAERSRCPHQLVYWEALRWAEQSGAREFDFGRSPRSSGTWQFKRGWGALERALHWTRFERDGAASLAVSSGDSTLLQALARLWRWLPPTMCDRLGPVLRRRIAS